MAELSGRPNRWGRDIWIDRLGYTRKRRTASFSHAHQIKGRRLAPCTEIDATLSRQPGPDTNGGMGAWFHDQRVFWRQFREQFHTTGSLLPSSRYLGRSLARFVGGNGQARRVLEVGPGTGAVTAQIVRRLGDADTLDLVELNDEFVRRLRHRFEHEEAFRRVAGRCRVFHQRVETLAGSEPYDVIVSGLPLNNFSAGDVEQILDVLLRLLRPGGMLSFFEYLAIRRARALVSSPAERARLKGIGQALDKVLKPYEFRCDWVWPNVPPAAVHHVRLPSPSDAHARFDNPTRSDVV